MPLSPPRQRLRKPSSGPGHLILGQLEDIENGVIRGWAIDRLNPQLPLKLRLAIDGRLEAVIDCKIKRPDLDRLHLPARLIGFEYRIPQRYRDGIRHILALSSLQGETLQLPDAGGRLYSEIHFSIASPLAIDGVVDGLVDGLIQGWALQTDLASGEKTGGLRLLISAGGEPIGELTADQFRADIADVGKVDPFCGFAYAVPPDLFFGRTIRLEVHAMPGRVALRHSPCNISIPSPSERGRIQGLIGRADELFRFAYELRKELRAALPADRYSLDNYEAWTWQNRDKIAARAAVRYGEISGRPLVSILCPVYCPNLPEFCSAIDSVRGQSYGNWELILVDDGSADAGLSEIIAGFARQEPRIRAYSLPRNCGISTATNRALEVARGEVSVFFDQDDMLDPNALEVMLRARSATGASLLYSDEDKIDQGGRFSQPNLKPDFNYRLLLEQNYICHLVMVETSLMHEIGGLDPRFDGAQDHDFLLKASEHIAGEAIHHVPEILYHWRISAISAAGTSIAKPNAADSAMRAVQEHLHRRNVKAKVTRRGGLTCYRVTFCQAGDPGVSILVPFRDHIEITAECVAAIRRHTRGIAYEILMLDNWSSSSEAEAFCAVQANMPDTKVIRIAEPFNYSRINNIGAARAKFPFLLFLNNDVMVQSDDWLSVLLSEALADPKTAAVGAKLLYPNGSVQHAGVVLGIGGVADHAFRGLQGHAPGYSAHAICGREVSAVTAACMLVRAEAFSQASGFDEAELGVAFNDIDLCLRLREAGHRIIFAPECVAEHHESMSRGDDLTQEKLARSMRENQVMLRRWGHLLQSDPFYNRHFAREGGIYRDLRVLEPADEVKFERKTKASAAFSQEKIVKRRS